MGQLGNVTLRGTANEVEQYTYNLTDTVVTHQNKAEYLGRAVSIDPTADCAVKLAEDGGKIYGKIFTIEVEQNGAVTVAVQTLGGMNLPVLSGVSTLTRGVEPVGAGDGFIKDGTEESTKTFVVDISTIAIDKTATVMFH